MNRSRKQTHPSQGRPLEIQSESKTSKSKFLTKVPVRVMVSNQRNFLLDVA